MKKRNSIKIFEIVSGIIYATVSMALLTISLTMVGYAMWEVLVAFRDQFNIIKKLLDAIGLIVISMAVFDVSKYFLEEEVLRDRELRSAHEARETLTKFLVIISIAVSLEALVFIFDAGTRDVTLLLYPTLLLSVSVLVVVGLGVYQRLSITSELDIKKEINRRY